MSCTSSLRPHTQVASEKLIPSGNQVLDKMYEATKEETDALRAKLDKAQKVFNPLPSAGLFLLKYLTICTKISQI